MTIGHLFATATDGQLSASNLRNRLVAPAVDIADAALEEASHPPLPEPLTPHSLRRTFISVLLSRRAGPVRDRAGRTTDPKVTLGIYARVMRRSEEDTTPACARGRRHRIGR